MAHLAVHRPAFCVIYQSERRVWVNRLRRWSLRPRLLLNVAFRPRPWQGFPARRAVWPPRFRSRERLRADGSCSDILRLSSTAANLRQCGICTLDVTYLCFAQCKNRNWGHSDTTWSLKLTRSATQRHTSLRSERRGTPSNFAFHLTRRYQRPERF